MMTTLKFLCPLRYVRQRPSADVEHTPSGERLEPPQRWKREKLSPLAVSTGQAVSVPAHVLSDTLLKPRPPHRRDGAIIGSYQTPRLQASPRRLRSIRSNVGVDLSSKRGLMRNDKFRREWPLEISFCIILYNCCCRAATRYNFCHPPVNTRDRRVTAALPASASQRLEAAQG
jgi:hypothetical protein